MALRRSLGVTGGVVAVLGLLAPPASATWSAPPEHTADVAVAAPAVRFADREAPADLTPASYREELQPTLGLIAARLSTLRAGWDAVAGPGVPDDRRGALEADLAAAERWSRQLSAVPLTGDWAVSWPQAQTITSLRAGLDGLVTDLRALRDGTLVRSTMPPPRRYVPRPAPAPTVAAPAPVSPPPPPVKGRKHKR